MNHTIIYGPKKNAAFKVRLPLEASGSSAIQVNPTIAAGDFKTNLDGQSFGNCTNLPTVTPAGGRWVEVSLTAAEMNGDVVCLQAVDAAGAEWKDAGVTIYTRTVTVDELVRSTTPANTLTVDATTHGLTGAVGSVVGDVGGNLVGNVGGTVTGGVFLTSGGLNGVFDFVVEGTKTFKQVIRGLAAVNLGNRAGGATSSVSFTGLDGSTVRVVMSQDATGNSTSPPVLTL